MPNLPSQVFSDDNRHPAHEVSIGSKRNAVGLRADVGILVHSPVNHRLLEAAAAHLGLQPVQLMADKLHIEGLHGFELIIADDQYARSIRQTLLAHHAEDIAPAIIMAYREGDEIVDLHEANHNFDGVLELPQAPGPLAIQLGLLLYSHRAYVRRHQSEIDELHLNRRIFRSLTNGICVADATQPDLPLTYVNPAFEVMTGYTLEEVRGRNCRFLQGEERNQDGLTQVREALQRKKKTTALVRNYRKDGTPFWNEVTISPIIDREGKLTHFVGVQNDVTERIEYEAMIRESEKLAAVGRLASSIAHEINNPLASVMNLIYIAEQTNCSVETKTFLTQADKELRRLKLITSRSLRFYKQSTRAQPTNCGELLESVLGLYASRFANSGILVEERHRLTPELVCMESEIRQVLNNLVSNAVDAMHGSGGRLLARVRGGTDWRTGRNGILFTIADTGSGMSREIQKDLYKAFFTTKGIGGTGLGMWISSEIVERHKGSLKVRSSQRETQTGTIFQMFLPQLTASD